MVAMLHLYSATRSLSASEHHLWCSMPDVHPAKTTSMEFESTHATFFETAFFLLPHRLFLFVSYEVTLFILTVFFLHVDLFHACQSTCCYHITFLQNVSTML